MAIKTVAVQVSANTFEVVEALANFALACKAALDDGFQPMDDLSEIVVAATKGLIPHVGKLGDVLEELKDNKEATAAAVLVATKNALAELLK